MAGVTAAHSRAVQDRIATLALSLFAQHGYPTPGGNTLGNIVTAALASVGADELRSPESLSATSLGRIDELVKGSVEAGRPRNIHGAEAARAAQAPGATDGTRVGSGFGHPDAIRGGSGARFRELGSGGGDSSRAGSASSGGGASLAGGAVTPEFARSFAGTGMSGGTLRTFAEVGLDRGTYNAFRKEGFSTAQITDNARDVKALGWHGKDDLAIAQHASTDVRKAAVATEQAKSPEQRAKCQAREAELEQQNEKRPDSDPQKQYNRRFFERRHQDHLRHDTKAGVGTEARQRDAGLATPTDKPAAGDHQAQDGRIAKGRHASAAKLTAGDQDDFGASAVPAATPVKPTPVRTAAAKPATPARG